MKTRVTLEFDHIVYEQLMLLDEAKTIGAIGAVIYSWMSDSSLSQICKEAKATVNLLDLDIKSELIAERSDG